jgi:hypothetical protein
MSLDTFTVTTDSSFMNGTCKNSAVVLCTPVDNRSIPCDTCKRSKQCEEEETDCSAFRTWTKTGDYNNMYINKTMRKL